MASLQEGGWGLIMGVPGKELDSETRKVIEKIQPAGFIIFTRNIETPEQTRKLLDDLRSSVQHEPVITIDQEGGRVSRLKECGNEPPSAKDLRDKKMVELIHWHGRLTGQLLRLFGFNLNLAPVLDVSFDDEADNSLRNRTWGQTPQEVMFNAGIFHTAMKEEGVLGCGKHFPGYSAAGVDPHHDLPRIERTRAELEATEWVPFQQLMLYLDSFMTCHAIIPEIDPDAPASLSPRAVRDILRKEWGYHGAIISDDLDMGAILNHCSFADSIRKAITAGNDLVLVCHRVERMEEAAAAIAELPEEVTGPARKEVDVLREKLQPARPWSMDEYQKLNDEVMELRIATLGEEKAKQRSADDSKRSPVEEF